MPLSGTSLAVLKSFVAGANAQYRSAGMPEYQMKVNKDGSVTTPKRPKPAFKRPPGSGEAAPSQATAGAKATAAAPSSRTQAASGGVQRAGAPPKITGLEQGGTDAFKLSWAPVAGAKQYGVWQDGVLIGHVPNPSFAGQVAQGAGGTIQIDAVLDGGRRTPLTPPLRASRGADGKLAFDTPGAPQAPAPAATPPAAPAPAATPPAATAAPVVTAPAAPQG